MTLGTGGKTKMKKAFTLIELLIVVAVLVTLMGLMFKLGAVGGDSYRRTRTITRMQKLENCLSGYNAAFGSYPPVKLHASRNINSRIDNYGHGMQTGENGEPNWNDEGLAWDQVQAACLAQPVACRFPFPDGPYNELIRGISTEMKRRAGQTGNEHYRKYWGNERIKKKLEAGFESVNMNAGGLDHDAVDWGNLQLFQFGVMSYILPRYLVMMNGNSQFYGNFRQWTVNNEMPSDPYTGRPIGEWAQLRNLVVSDNMSDLAKVANIPSQSVCARWMPNLAGACRANHNYKLFGVSLRDDTQGGNLSVENPWIEVFSATGGNSQQYVLDEVTMVDGWLNPFYYYSPAPYQRYILWSGGPNGKTFPPWVSRDSLGSKAKSTVGSWTHDDIVHMSN